MLLNHPIALNHYTIGHFIGLIDSWPGLQEAASNVRLVKQLNLDNYDQSN